MYCLGEELDQQQQQHEAARRSATSHCDVTRRTSRSPLSVLTVAITLPEAINGAFATLMPTAAAAAAAAPPPQCRAADDSGSGGQQARRLAAARRGAEVGGELSSDDMCRTRCLPLNH